MAPKTTYRTYFQKLKEEKPELFFDGSGKLLSDEEFLKKITKGADQETKLEVARRLYSEVPEEAPSFTEKLLAPVAQTVARAAVPALATREVEERDFGPLRSVQEGEKVRDAVARHYGIPKASTTGLARYLKVVKDDPRSINEIKEYLDRDAISAREELISETGNSPQGWGGSEYLQEEVDAFQQEEQGRQEQQRLRRVAVERASDISQNMRLPTSMGGYTPRASAGSALDTASTIAQSSILKALGGAAYQTGDVVAGRTDPLGVDARLKDRLQKEAAQEAARRAQRADFSGTTEQLSQDLYEAKLRVAKKLDDGLAFRESMRGFIEETTGEVATPLFDQAAAYDSEVRSKRLNVLGEFAKSIDNVKGDTALDRASGYGKALYDVAAQFATNPQEILFLLADSAPTVLSAVVTKSPAAGAGLGSYTQRLGAGLADVPEEERQGAVAEESESALRGAVVDAFTAGALGKLLPKIRAGSAREGVGAAGEAVGGAASEYAADPTASLGQLSAEALGEFVAGGATERAPAAVASAITSPESRDTRIFSEYADSLRAETAAERSTLEAELRAKIEAEEAEKERLRQSPDPLDRAEAAIADMPPGKDLFGEPTDLADKTQQLPTERTSGAEDIQEAEATIRRNRQKEEASVYADAISLVREGYLDPEEVADYVALEADRIEKSRQEKPKKEQSAVQEELPLTGGVQPEAGPQRPEGAQRVNPVVLEQVKAKADSKRVAKKLTDFGTSPKYQFTEADRGLIEQQAQAEGLPPISRKASPRDQFNRLSEDGQNAVIAEAVRRELPVRKTAPKSRVDAIIKRVSQGPTQPAAARTTASATPAPQPSASQTVSEAPGSTQLRDRIVALSQEDKAGRVALQAAQLLQAGVEPEAAVRQAVTEAQKAGAPLGNYTQLAEELNLDTKKAKPLRPLLPIENAPSGINALRASGRDVTPASRPDTIAARRAEKLAKAFGTNIEWFSQPKGAGFANGAYSSATPNTVYVNTAAVRPVDVIAGHELNHKLERNPTYKAAVQKALAAYANSKGLESWVEARKSRGYSAEKAPEEVRSDLLGEALKDPSFFNDLRRAAGDTPGLFERILDWITGVFDRVVGRAGRGEVSQDVLTDIKGYRDALLQAVEQSRATPKQQATRRPQAVRELTTDLDAEEAVDFDEASPRERRRNRVAERLSTVKETTRKLGLTVGRFRGIAQKETADAVQREAFERTAMGKEHERIAHALQKVARDHKITQKRLDAALRGDTQGLPKEVQEAVQEARNEIDRQSDVLMSLLGSGASRNTIEKNLKTYVSKSYQAWENPEVWAREVKYAQRKTGETLYEYALQQVEMAMAIPQDFTGVRADAIERLAAYWGVEVKDKASNIAELENIRDLWPEDKRRETILAARDAVVYPTKKKHPLIENVKTALKGANRVLDKIDTPPWIREVWGEIQDGTYNFITTAERQAALIAKYRTLDRLAAEMLRNGTASFTPARDMVLVPRGSSNGPLAGLWMKQDDYDFLNQTIQIIDETTGIDYPGMLTRFWLGLKDGTVKLNAWFKASNFVYDASTVMVQATSSIWSGLIASGRPPAPAEFKRAVDTALADVFYDKASPEARARSRESTKLGVSSEGVWSAEIKGALKRSLEAELNSLTEYNPSTIWGAIKRGLATASAPFSNTIQFGDTLARAIVFEIEKTELSQDFPDKSEKEINEIAAARMRNILPTYSQTSPGARAVSASGFINPVMTFTWEVHRNMAWNTLYALQDIRNGKTTRRKMLGITRLAGVSAQMYGVGKLLQWVTSNTIVPWLFKGMEEDEEGPKKVDPEDLKYLVNSYHEHSDLLVPVAISADGQFTYLNPGRFHAFEPMEQLATKALRGEFVEAANAWGESVWADAPMLGGFLGNPISRLAAASVLQVADKPAEVDRHLADARRDAERIIPGIVQRMYLKPQRLREKGDPMSDEEYFLENTGMTVHKADVNDRVRSTLTQLQNAWQYNRKVVKDSPKQPSDTLGVIEKLFTGEMSQEEINSVYAGWIAENREAFNIAYEKMNAYKKYLSNDRLKELAKEAGLSQDNLRSVLSGEFPMPKLDVSRGNNDIFMTREQRELQNARGEERKQEVKKKWARIRSQFREAELNYRRQMDGN